MNRKDAIRVIANYVKESWIKPGAIVLEVGINRIMKNGKTKLSGDVDFNKIVNKASAISPVPGGVGPMTIACLLKNTIVKSTNKNFKYFFMTKIL